MDENHKGQWCTIIARTCQEGFCSECWAYIKWDKVLENINKEKLT